MASKGRNPRDASADDGDDTDAALPAYRDDGADPTIASPGLRDQVRAALDADNLDDDTDAALYGPRLLEDPSNKAKFDDPTIATPSIAMGSGEVPVFGDPTIATPSMRMPSDARPSVVDPARPSFDDPTALDPHNMQNPDFVGQTLAGAVLLAANKTGQRASDAPGPRSTAGRRIIAVPDSPASSAPEEPLPGQGDPSIKLTAIRRSVPPPPPANPAETRSRRVHVLREETRRAPPPPPAAPSRPRAAVAAPPPRKPRAAMIVAVIVSLIAILVVGIAISVALR